MKSSRILFSGVILWLIVGSGGLNAQLSAFTPVTDEILRNPADQDWLIDRNNVGNLQLVWSRALNDTPRTRGPGGVAGEGVAVDANGNVYAAEGPGSTSAASAEDARTHRRCRRERSGRAPLLSGNDMYSARVV